jgi:hypothetical protein
MRSLLKWKWLKKNRWSIFGNAKYPFEKWSIKSTLSWHWKSVRGICEWELISKDWLGKNKWRIPNGIFNNIFFLIGISKMFDSRNELFVFFNEWIER